MDPSIEGFQGLVQMENLVSGSELNGRNHEVDHSSIEFDHHLPNQNQTNDNVTPHEEDCDFSDTVLKYISQMLMEEDIEDKDYMFPDSLAVQVAEKSFYDVIGKKYPPSPEPIQNSNGNLGSSCSYNDNISSFRGSGYLDDVVWNHGQRGLQVNVVSQSSYSSPNSAITSVDSPNSSTVHVPDFNCESQSILQFQKGVEEASKFLLGGSDFKITTESNKNVVINVEKRDDGQSPNGGSRRRKNPYGSYEDVEEERSSKQLASSAESNLPAEEFDKLLLYTAGEGRTELAMLRDALKDMAIKNEQYGKSKGYSGGRGRGKKGAGKKEFVDLRSILVTCAQAIAADDRKTASELLKQVRQHSSLFGDGNQRLAHCFANGLEARLAGTGSQIYKGLIGKKTSAADVLKAYHLYLAVCPFRKLSNFVSNKTIRNMSANSSRIHVIDFGVHYGFQWPTFIQRLAMQPGGAPKLRITGIDFPQPGFRPAARIEDTGRRLADYAKKFDVQFEYNAIAKKWDNIKLEELKIDRDEFIAVTCIYRAKNLHDETVVVDSPRNIVLNFIRKINPDIFIHGIVNGGFNAPFFVTRFREALFHFSAMFDMLEALVPRQDQERLLIEKEIFGREALNVIACEGWERVERPETYKQWQVRCMRAGFVQFPFAREIVESAKVKVRNLYHKNFLIDEDSKCLLQGWKGRIIYTLSAWKPA